MRGKMALIIKTDAASNVCDGLLRGDEQLASMFEPGAKNVLVRCEAGGLLEHAGEVEEAQAALRSHGGERKIFTKVIVNVFDGLAQLAFAETAAVDGNGQAFRGVMAHQMHDEGRPERVAVSRTAGVVGLDLAAKGQRDGVEERIIDDASEFQFQPML